MNNQYWWQYWTLFFHPIYQIVPSTHYGAHAERFSNVRRMDARKSMQNAMRLNPPHSIRTGAHATSGMNSGHTGNTVSYKSQNASTIDSYNYSMFDKDDNMTTKEHNIRYSNDDDIHWKPFRNLRMNNTMTNYTGTNEVTPNDINHSKSYRNSHHQVNTLLNNSIQRHRSVVLASELKSSFSQSVKSTSLTERKILALEVLQYFINFIKGSCSISIFYDTKDDLDLVSHFAEYIHERSDLKKTLKVKAWQHLLIWGGHYFSHYTLSTYSAMYESAWIPFSYMIKYMTYAFDNQYYYSQRNDCSLTSVYSQLLLPIKYIQFIFHSKF